MATINSILLSPHYRVISPRRGCPRENFDFAENFHSSWRGMSDSVKNVNILVFYLHFTNISFPLFGFPPNVSLASTSPYPCILNHSLAVIPITLSHVQCPFFLSLTFHKFLFPINCLIFPVPLTLAMSLSCPLSIAFLSIVHCSLSIVHCPVFFPLPLASCHCLMSHISGLISQVF